MNKVNKAKRKVDYLISKAKKERDEKGYRENLGYDLIHVLEDYLSKLGLHYVDNAGITEYFYSECDKI